MLAAMRAHPHGARAAVIGACVAEHPGMVVGADGARRHPRGRPADRRAATADLLNDPVASLFARYAFPPNELGYCGPPTRLKPNSPRHAKEFDGAWPYLQAIAEAAGLSDPLDEDVVRNYWVGGPLLDKVDPAELLTRLRDAFTGQVTGMLDDITADNVLAHHSFHVFAVYPWVGFLDRDPIDAAAGDAGLPDPLGHGRIRR